MSDETKDRASASIRGANGDDREIVPLQLAMLEDVGQRSLQDRFREFCDDAYTALTAVHAESGEPLHEAGKAKASLTIKVTIVRTHDDSLAFDVSHDVAAKLPKPPGKSRSAQVVRGIGLAQPVRLRQMPLYDRDSGQPQPMTKADALGRKTE